MFHGGINTFLELFFHKNRNILHILLNFNLKNGKRESKLPDDRDYGAYCQKSRPRFLDVPADSD